MKAIRLVLMSIAILAGLVSAQDRLSEADYTTALAKALDAASSRDMRILTDETYYTGSQVTGSRRIVSDFARPDSKKIDVSEEFNGRQSKSDSIRIAGQFFCREGDKGWKKANKECAKNGKLMAIPNGVYEYSVEPDSNNYGRKIYTRRAKFTDSGSPEREAVRMKFIEIKFTTDETGAITEYTETRRGGIEPNGWSSTQVTKYIYDPADLKVTDPTKEN